MIIFQNNSFLVINKPAGISFQGEENSFLSQLKQQLQCELYPVHRLDKITSGITVVAKTPEANSELSQLFQAREVSKIYLALSDVKPKKKQGLVKGDLEKSRNGSWKLSRSVDNPSITQFFSFPAESGVRLCVLKPSTGKTHQLRVVMKSLGASILGDKRYGGSDADRGYLHAYELAFKFRGEDFCWRALPEEGKHWPQQVPDLQSLNWPKLNLGRERVAGGKK
ncbi:MAG: TIGR01621 family pseudouridine synthase [Cellvibrionaceae bacterium]